MIKLLLLLKKIHFVLLFFILESIAMYSYIHSSPYTQAFSMRLSTSITGTANEKISAIGNYFNLNEQNIKLKLENAQLRGELIKLQSVTVVDSTTFVNDTITHDISDSQPQQVLVARVIKNSYNKQNNFITLNKGTNEGFKPNMALFNSNGIVGYTLHCSPHFTVAISTLNAKDFRTGGRLKGTDFTGSISWDGNSYKYLTIEEVPKYADIKIGDTIVTTFSNIFPDNLPIGTIEQYEMTSGTFYTARIKMFADISSLGYVYATSLENQQELMELQSKVIEQ